MVISFRYGRVTSCGGSCSCNLFGEMINKQLDSWTIGADIRGKIQAKRMIQSVRQIKGQQRIQSQHVEVDIESERLRGLHCGHRSNKLYYVIGKGISPFLV